eukprot:TRINITY_DN66575_c9_g2_i1.p1 TRINITY_DN66575_c9_g2~~TRINITY_DN66575_c9_g2_i1.p1  ORF type:complete len:246 (+),score=15.84 TRINITY_DN66575_c9_g2_i1:142-879(+)
MHCTTIHRVTKHNANWLCECFWQGRKRWHPYNCISATWKQPAVAHGQEQSPKKKCQRPPKRVRIQQAQLLQSTVTPIPPTPPPAAVTESPTGDLERHQSECQEHTLGKTNSHAGQESLTTKTTAQLVSQFLQHPYFRENEDYYTVLSAEEGYEESEFTHLALPPMSTPPIFELNKSTYPTPFGQGLRAYQLNPEQLWMARKICKSAGVVPVKLKPKQWVFLRHLYDCNSDPPAYCNAVASLTPVT